MIDAGCKHTIIAETEMTLVEIQLGDEIYIEDKKKFTLN
jgi:mannose-1-phosphate guanylyltransferase